MNPASTAMSCWLFFGLPDCNHVSGRKSFALPGEQSPSIEFTCQSLVVDHGLRPVEIFQHIRNCFAK
jgi:hypothetical protein